MLPPFLDVSPVTTAVALEPGVLLSSVIVIVGVVI